MKKKKTGVVLHDSKKNDLLSLAGTYDVSDIPGFLNHLRSVQILNVSDYEDYELQSVQIRERYMAAGFRAMLVASLVRHGRLISSLVIGDTETRNWSDDDETLLADVAERTWAAIERAKAEMAVQKSEQELRLFLTASSNMVYRMSADWKSMYLLDGKNILEDTEDPTGDWTKKYIPLDALPMVWQNIQQAIDTKSIFELEHRIFQADGTVGWVLSRAVPVLDRYGNISEWIGTGSDITERKKAESTLQRFNERLEKEVAVQTSELIKSRTLLQATLDSNTEMIQVFQAVRDDQGNIVDFVWLLNNKASEKIYGNVIGQSLLNNNPGVVDAGIFANFVSVVETGVAQQHEKHYVNEQFDGWYYQSAVKLEDGVVTTTVNITERKKTDLQIAESRDQLQSILDTTLVQMSILEAVRDEANVIVNFRIKAVNGELVRETGRTDLVGKLYATEYPGIRQTGLFDMIVTAIETGEPQSTEYFYAHDGFNKWFSCMFVKLGDGVVASNMNISERKQAEEDRFKDYLLLQQSEEMALLGSWDYQIHTGTFTWSNGMYRLFDVQQGAIVQPEIYLEYTTEDGRAAAERVVNFIRSGKTNFEETLELNISGRLKMIHIKAFVVNDAEGQPVRVLGVDIDISATKAAEEKIRHMEVLQQMEILQVTLRTQEEERRRISESLHNGLGQLLYGIKMSLFQLNVNQAINNEDEYNKARRYTSELLSDAMRETRRISHELMPTVLNEFGLNAAINDVCSQMQDGTSFNCVIELKDYKLDKYTQLAVFRTVQELMINIVKHADATRALVEVRINEENIHINVSDNGKGMETHKQGKNGIGLASIKSKVDLLNGTVHITSEKNRGTSINIILPYTQQTEN